MTFEREYIRFCEATNLKRTSKKDNDTSSVFTTSPEELTLALFTSLGGIHCVSAMSYNNNKVIGNLTFTLEGSQSRVKRIFLDAKESYNKLQLGIIKPQALVEHLINAKTVKIHCKIQYKHEVEELEDQCVLCESDLSDKVYVLSIDNATIILCNKCGSTLESWGLLDVVYTSKNNLTKSNCKMEVPDMLKDVYKAYDNK